MEKAGRGRTEEAVGERFCSDGGAASQRRGASKHQALAPLPSFATRSNLPKRTNISLSLSLSFSSLYRLNTRGHSFATFFTSFSFFHIRTHTQRKREKERERDSLFRRRSVVVPFVLLGFYHLSAALSLLHPAARPSATTRAPPRPPPEPQSVVSSFSGIYESLATRTSVSRRFREPRNTGKRGCRR